MRKQTGTLLAILSLSLAACEGPAGTQGAAGKDGTNGNNGQNGQQGTPGAPGDAGPPGSKGDPGAAGCDGLAAGDVAKLDVKLTVAPPANGQFFAVGEKAVFTVNLIDRCNRAVPPANLSTVSLYMSGPRDTGLTKTAAKMLNAVVDRKAADRQHHFINLLKPSFLDNTQTNLVATDTGWTFTTAPVSTEAPGTYAAGLWVVSKDLLDQQFLIADLQIATATVEAYTTGDATTSKCYSCHLGSMSGKSYQAHIAPGFSPEGNYALDQTPVANCKLCHNNDGYSVNPIVAKVHAAHRGEHQLNPGAGHPEYGWPADATLAEYVNIAFPAFPNAERNCVSCHVNDDYLQKPSRMACGTCHDNLFYDTGVLSPARNFGKPAKGVQYAASAAFACTNDGDCAGFGQLVTCDLPSGTCQRTAHVKQTDDTQCLTCHGDNGLSPTAIRHDVPSQNASENDGVTLSDVTITGMTGGADPQKPTFFQVGDVPVVTFKVSNKAGVVSTLTNKADPNYANWSASLNLSGPNDNAQRVWPNQNLKTCVNAQAQPCLTFDANSGLYTFTLPIVTGEVNPGWPALALLPLDSQPTVLPSDRQPNVAGSYTVWLWVYETLRPAPPNIRNVSWRNVANFLTAVQFGAEGTPVRRQVVQQSACDSCHVVTQAHGGSRQMAEGCFTCHSQGAEDQGVIGTKGAKCTTATQAVDCTGFNNGTQECQDTNNDGTADTCILVKDPTPNQMVDFSIMIHQIHFGRKLEGYNQRNNIPLAGKLQINTGDFSEILFPQDIRNCTKCHADSKDVCSATVPCGVGQTCVGGACQNVAYLTPSTRVCTSCHDADDTAAHAAIMTYQSADGPIESCAVCHGDGADFGVAKVHNITNPYVPPYDRNPPTE